MKRVGKWSLLVLAFFLLTLPVFGAESVTYEPYTGFCIDIPEHYGVYTRDIEADHPNLSKFGYTKEALLQDMEQSGMYLEAWDENTGDLIIVALEEYDMEDFNTLSHEDQRLLLMYVENGMLDDGTEVFQSQIYQHDQTVFFVFDISVDFGNGKEYWQEYLTVYGGRKITIYLQSLSEIDEAMAGVMRTVVDSVRFDEGFLPAAEIAETEPFLYEDSETGVTFTVPKNWEQADPEDLNGTQDAVFVSREDGGTVILYSSEDVWESVPDDVKNGFTRAEADGSLLSKEVIAEMLNTTVDRISTTAYQGKEYYQVQMDVGSVPTTLLSRLENGYFYVFHFQGDSTSPLYPNFEALLSSVAYPASETSGVEAAAEKSEENRNSNRAWAASLLSALMLTVIVHPLPICLYRFCVRRKPVSPENARVITVADAIGAVILLAGIFVVRDLTKIPLLAAVPWTYVSYRILIAGYPEQEESTVPAPEEEPPAQDRFCRNCGQKLPPRAAFCTRCGTKVNEEP